MAENKLILVTNDDGIQADGLRALAESIEDLGDVFTVAPELEQSASSHSITLDKPLRINDHGRNRYGVSGTPTDCVLLAIHRILERKPDILISGINHGPNSNLPRFHFVWIIKCLFACTTTTLSIHSYRLTRKYLHKVT